MAPRADADSRFPSLVEKRKPAKAALPSASAARLIAHIQALDDTDQRAVRMMERQAFALRSRPPRMQLLPRPDRRRPATPSFAFERRGRAVADLEGRLGALEDQRAALSGLVRRFAHTKHSA